jgi:hypothetical protein
MASNSVGSDLLRYPLSKQLVSYSSSEDEDCDHTETPDDAEIPGEAEILLRFHHRKRISSTKQLIKP